MTDAQSPKDLVGGTALPDKTVLAQEPGPATAGALKHAPAAMRRSMPMGMSIAMGILLAGVIGWLFHYLMWFILVLYISFIGATILEAPVQWLKRRGMRRGLAAVAVMLGSLMILLAVGYFITLGVYGQVATARADLAKAPERINNFVNSVRHHFLPRQAGAASQPATDASAPATGATATSGPATQTTEEPATASGPATKRSDDVDVVSAIGSNLTMGAIWTNTMWIVETLSWLVIAFFIVLYMLVDGADHLRGLRRLLPKSQRLEATRLFNEIAQAHRGWALASLANVVSASILTGLGLWLCGIPGALMFGIVAGFGELIPNIGPFLGAVPAIGFTLLAEPEKFVYVLGMFVVVQTIQSYTISPQMLKFSVQLPVLATILSVLVFGTLFGFLGVLVAIPLVADLVVVWDYANRYLEKDTEDYDSMNAPVDGVRAQMAPDNTHPSRLRKMFRKHSRANPVEGNSVEMEEGLDRLAAAERKSVKR